MGFVKIFMEKLFLQVSIQHTFGDQPVGKGYDVCSDQVKTLDIFSLEETHEEMGFKIPKGFCLSKVNQKETFEYTFEDKVSLAQQRLTNLGIAGGVDPNLLNLKARAGFSMGGKQSGQSAKSEYSYFYESRPFKMSIANLDQLKLSAGFRQDVASDTFPSEYIDESDTTKYKEMTEFFKQFFSKWGHYIVISAFVGGSVELKTSSVDTNNKGSSSSDLSVGLAFGFKKLSLGANVASSSSSDGNLGTCFSSIKLNWDGGDPQFQASNLDVASPEKWKSWEESLNSCPSILTTSLQLLPISDAITKIDSKKGSVCQRIMNNLIGIKTSPTPTPTVLKEVAEKQHVQTRKEAADEAKPDSSSCFPGTAMVITKNSIYPKMVYQLSIGDEVLCMDPETKKEIFSKVYMFGHQNEETKTSFLKISCDNVTNITLSPKHLIFVNNSFKVKPADQVEIGDYLVTRNQSDPRQEVQPAKVVKIEEVILDGFYAPFTLCGNMIVDGFLASCYANVNDVTLPLLGKMSAQDVAHLGTAPLRMAYLLGSRDVLKLQEDQEMPKCIETMHKIGRKMKIAF
jgi:hypothetical protein